MVRATWEIERKWLLSELPDLSEAKKVHIKQGYLPILSGALRLRREKLESGQKKYYLQFKSGEIPQRLEWSEELPKNVFNGLWQNVGDHWLKKIRYYLPMETGETLEFDEYKGSHKGLLIMECEFPDLLTSGKYRPPAWIKIKREVTYDKKYGNKTLAVKGLP